jgi:hypothetical protein
VTLYLRHRTVGGVDSSAWEFDPARRVVDVVLRHPPLAIEPIWVCTATRPRFGAHVLVRIDESTWRISLAAYAYPDLRRAPVPRAHHPHLPPCELVLTHCPPLIAAELEHL